MSSSLLVAFALLAASPKVAPPRMVTATRDDDIRNSVVKILVTQRAPELTRPWQKASPADASGSGVVLDGKRILTNAHVVAYSTQVRVQPNQSSDKLTAKVEQIVPSVDLAILKLDDESFFDTHAPAPMSDTLPKIGSKVSTYGFPIGGDTMSVTEGVVSRIEYANYGGGGAGLRIQVDAAINPGNSGGAATVDGKVIGITFSGLRAADNIGFLIPTEEVKAFLADIADGHFDGRPRIFADMQTVENDALRARLGIDKSVTGLMVTNPKKGAEGDLLQPWDIVTHVGAQKIDNDGMVDVGDNLRLEMQYFVPRFAQDGKVPLTIHRGTQTVKLDVPVKANTDRLLKPLNNRYPSYFIYGPMCFTPVYEDLFASLASRAGLLGFLARKSSPIVSRADDERAFPGEELVIVSSPMFPHPMGKGYDVQGFPVVGKVNGTPIKNLKHLVEVLRDLKDEYVTFEWADQGTEIVVFKRADVKAATDAILEDNGVRSQCSPDLEKVWNGS